MSYNMTLLVRPGKYNSYSPVISVVSSSMDSPCRSELTHLVYYLYLTTPFISLLLYVLLQEIIGYTGMEIINYFFQVVVD